MAKNPASSPADHGPAASSTAILAARTATARAAATAASSSSRAATSASSSSTSGASTLHIGWCPLCEWCERAPFRAISSHLAACRERHQAMVAQHEAARHADEVRRRAVHSLFSKRR